MSQKQNEALDVRCQILSAMIGTSKIKQRLAVTQYKMFTALKENAGFAKFSKHNIENRDRILKEKMK